MTQRDGMGRDVGGEFMIGTYVHPWQIHVDVWQNQYNIVKQLASSKNKTKQNNGFSSVES